MSILKFSKAVNLISVIPEQESMLFQPAGYTVDWQMICVGHSPVMTRDQSLRVHADIDKIMLFLEFYVDNGFVVDAVTSEWCKPKMRDLLNTEILLPDASMSMLSAALFRKFQTIVGDNIDILEVGITQDQSGHSYIHNIPDTRCLPSDTSWIQSHVAHSVAWWNRYDCSTSEIISDTEEEHTEILRHLPSLDTAFQQPFDDVNLAARNVEPAPVIELNTEVRQKWKPQII